mmetsp:Transcript_20713/g.67319  ORF Transcript_20713/g.67319 Transcript_20713/m.67319 type:complete len:225 (-) Transcript_20713:248-922(-)
MRPPPPPQRTRAHMAMRMPYGPCGMRPPQTQDMRHGGHAAHCTSAARHPMLRASHESARPWYRIFTRQTRPSPRGDRLLHPAACEIPVAVAFDYCKADLRPWSHWISEPMCLPVIPSCCLVRRSAAPACWSGEVLPLVITPCPNAAVLVSVTSTGPRGLEARAAGASWQPDSLVWVIGRRGGGLIGTGGVATGAASGSLSSLSLRQSWYAPTSLSLGGSSRART